MPRKRHKPEELVTKLRQVDVLVSQGQGITDAIRQIGVSEVTYYRWRQEFGGLKTEQVKRLKDLETENIDPHALEIDDGLGEYRKGRRQRAMRAGIEPLVPGDSDLVVDPAELRIPLPGICIFGRDVHPGRTVGAFKILHPPRVGFADRHE